MKRSRTIVVALLTGALLSCTVLFALISPRPYAFNADDLENDYYHNGWLVAAGSAELADVYHPGTPIHYLSAGIINLVGNDPAKTQDVLNVAYVIIGIVNALAIALFIFLLPLETPAAVAFLCGALIIAPTPFLKVLNAFGEDAFLSAALLPALALIWSALLNMRRFTQKLLIGVGLLLGLSMAIKFIAAPLMLAVSVALVPLLWRLMKQKQLPWYAPLVVPAVATVSFMALAYPALGRFDELQAKMHTSGWIHTAIHMVKNPFLIVNTLPLYTLIAYLILGVAACLWVWDLDSRSTHLAGREDVRRDRMTVDIPLFLGALLANGAYAVARINLGYISMDTGSTVRYLIPSFLVLPFLVHYIALHFQRSIFSRWLQRGIAAVAVLLLAVSVSLYQRERVRMVAYYMDVESALEEAITLHSRPGERVAVMHLASDNRGNPRGNAVFHFWGFRRAVRPQGFDDAMLKAFPHEAYFRYDLARDIVAGKPLENPEEEVISGEKQKLFPTAFILSDHDIMASDFANRGTPMMRFLSRRIGRPLYIFPVTALGKTWTVLSVYPQHVRAS
ncbi:hypothetical protein EXS70_00025 [Candidatus Peribacteria bacterium]|nr:hypothetical protein [Candidatus Peribacteria bacterium]